MPKKIEELLKFENKQEIEKDIIEYLTNFKEMGFPLVLFLKKAIFFERSFGERISGCLTGDSERIPERICRMAAISVVTFFPGSFPPIPGFAPCEILISIISAIIRRSSETPNRPVAYCKVILSANSLSSSNIPPSPVLATP